MMSQTINKKIEQLEILQKKLIESQTMQGILSDFISKNLKKNLACFKDFYPEIFKMFTNFKLVNYKIICFKDCEPNVLNLKTGNLLYPNDPYLDTKNQVNDWASGKTTIRMRYAPEIYHDAYNQFSFTCCNKLAQKVMDLSKDIEPFKEVPSSVPTVILIGGGLGFPLSEIYSHTSAINFFYIEPDIELFYCSLCVFDWEPILKYIASNQYDLRFIIGKSVEATIDALEAFYLDDYPYVLGYQVILQHYNSIECSAILERLKISSDKVAVRLGQFDDKMFGLANELKNLHKYKVLPVNPLPKEFLNLPVLVVGNGPSLDDDLPEIKRLANDCLIIACGTAFNSLLKFGIQPDIYVALERISTVADTLKEIINLYDFSKTLCITPDLVHPKTLELFPKNLLFFKLGESLKDNLSATFGYIFKPYLFCECLGPLVSNCGLSLALSLGFTNVWMVGIDNGSSRDYGHSKFSSYYDDEGKLKSNCKNMLLDNMDLEIKGNFRKNVRTNFMFLNSISFMEKLISYHPNACVKNSSDGAFVAGTVPQSLKQLLITYNNHISKSAILEKLLNNSLNFNIDSSMLKLIKNQKVFNEVVEHIIKNINKFLESADSRESVNKSLKEISKYLLDYEGIYKVSKDLLRGTLASMFSDIISLMYTLNYGNNESRLVSEIKPLFDYIKEFLNGSKFLYEHIDEYTQGNHIKFQQDIANEQ